MSILANVVDVFVDDDGRYGNPLGIIWASSSTRKHEQQIAADLGFSETIFVDGVDGVATARIFTPTQELPFAGHPTVGLAAWLHRNGDEVKWITVPAGSVAVRFEGERAFVTAMAEWTPQFEFQQLDSADELAAVDPDAYAQGLHYLWAWTDEPAQRMRSRMFARDLGIREDEATGAGAIRLTSELGRDLEITQGQGSVLHTLVRSSGREIEVGGNVSEARPIELR
jgi:predicted PhzF superfamily epimerase YddE/YHI9